MVSGGDPVSFVDPGSFSGILYRWETERKLTFCSLSRQNFLEVWVGRQGPVIFGGDPDQDQVPGFINPDQDMDLVGFRWYVWQVDSTQVMVTHFI